MSIRVVYSFVFWMQKLLFENLHKMWHGEIMKKRGRKSNFQPNTIIQIEPPLLWLLSPPNKWPILKGGNQSTNSDYLRNVKSKQGGGLVRKSNLKMEGGVVSFSLFFLFSFLPCPEGSPGHKTLQLCFFGSENQEKQSSQTRECGRICFLSLSFLFPGLALKATPVSYLQGGREHNKVREKVWISGHRTEKGAPGSQRVFRELQRGGSW